MKPFEYKGPGGEIRVQDPLAVRLVESTWFLTILTLAFVAWGAYYLYFADPQVFLGRRLSPAHQKLEKECMACHSPFAGVTDEACASTDCHPGIAQNTIHNTRDARCFSCHREHTDGAPLPVGVANSGCAQCHDRLQADPKSIFYPPNYERRQITNVPRAIFRHRLHQYPPHYKCSQCHCIGDKTLNLRMEQLFRMDSCMKCHEQADCAVCHKYHQQREPRPRTRACIKQDFVSELQFKTLECTPYRGREPGFENMTVCETGAPAALPGATAASAPAPAPAPGDTAAPAPDAGGAAPPPLP
jgi:hypothetical protein